MLALHRDRDGVDVLEVLDAGDGTTLASLTVPHVPTADLLATWEAAGLLGVPGSMRRRDDELLAGLGRPDLLAHRLGYEGGVRGAGWYEWPDGSWRALAKPADTRHTVTASPAGDGTLRLTVVEQPGGQVRLDVIVPDVDDTVSWTGLNAALDAHGYTVAGPTGLWERLPGEVRYARARPGRLAVRDWWTVAKVRIIRQITVGAVDPAIDRTFQVGEVLTMNQRGRAGDAIDRGSWWSSYDIDGAHIIPADHVEIVQVLEDHPPTE